MDYSATFARHFARLVSLLMYDAANIDEQKMSLRALVTVSKNGSVGLASRDWELFANDQLIPGALTGVADVASQMADHALSEIQIGAASSAADLLGLARIIATRSASDDGATRASQKLAALGARSITFVTTTSAPVVPEAERDSPTPPASNGSNTPLAVSAEPEAHALLQSNGVASSGIDVTRVSIPELFEMLDAAKTEESVTRALDELVSLAEHSMRIGKPAAVADILHGVVSRDGRVDAGDWKRSYVMAIRRMSKPALLRAVATLIPKKPERKEIYGEILARTGEDGADAVIEQITQAQTNEDRRSLLAVLGGLESGVASLVRMLGDSRWFVARNAADLLGEIKARNAEAALVAALRHTDDRVRRSATNALLQLGTPRALKAIYAAVTDRSPEVRMQAAAAISSRKDNRSSSTLIRAIEEEEDVDVQLAMVAALGKVATPEAVQKLVKMSEPEGLFRKKTTALRIAAAQALSDAKTALALAALRDLTEDKDRDVRETAHRALAQASAR